MKQTLMPSLYDWQQGGEWIVTSAGKLFVRSHGTGPTLLLIHGFPTSSWDWHAISPELLKRFHVLSVDMLGYGFSDKPAKAPYSTSLQVQLIQQVLNHKSINSAHIMTYSYGVSVAQEMLRQQQAGTLSTRILSLCLMNGGLFPDSNHPKLSQKLLLGKAGNLFVKLFNKQALKSNLQSIFGPQTQPAQALIDEYWQLINYNQGKTVLPKLIQYLAERKQYAQQWEQALRMAGCPVQLIVGDQDVISGIAVADEYRTKISRQHVHILPGIGHYPQLEAADDVLRLYYHFLEQTMN